MYTIVGLGNPGEEYENTRHNTGRIVLSRFFDAIGADESTLNKKYLALTTTGALKKEKVLVIFPETYMNKSGGSLKSLITNKKKAEQLVVVHDDLDLALGKIKITFNRGSGGHRGVESIIRAIKTEGFIRVRVGISPATPSGKIKKSKDIDTFIVGKFSPKELEAMKKVSKTVCQALLTIIGEGKDRAMSEFNS